VQTGLACLPDYDFAKCGVSIGGAEPKYYDIKPDRELQEMIEEGAAAFWDKVVKRIPPDPISNEDCSRIFNKVNGSSIMIYPELVQDLIDLKAIRTAIKSCEIEKEKLEVKIKTFLGNNEVLVDENMVPLCTWKAAKGAARIDAEALRFNYPEVAAAVTKTGEPNRRFLVK